MTEVDAPAPQVGGESGNGAPARLAPDIHLSTLDLTDRPDTVGQWWADIWSHRDVLMVLARKDFHTRYKRAAFGVAWAVVVPLIQATVLAVVFSRVIRAGGGPAFGAYVMSGIIPFTYFSSVLVNGTTSIVDGSSFADKVWFPRILLVAVPALSNLVGLFITLLALIALMPALGGSYGWRLFLIIPALALLTSFVGSLTLVTSALYVYFRDMRFLVQASLMVWMYVTPIVYPLGLLHQLKGYVEANPLTGIVTLFHLATVGGNQPILIPVVVTAGTTVILLICGLEGQRRHDRLFVDLL